MKLSPVLMCLTLLAACGDDRLLEEIVSLPDEAGLEPRVAQVIGDARARVEADRRDVKAWRHLGAVLDAHRLSPSAESAYREALRLDEDDPWTCYQLAIVLAMMDKEPEEALRLFDKVAAALPQSPYPIINRGRVLDASGDSEGARDAYLRALELDERQPLVQRALGQVFLDLGANADALQHLERAASLSPKSDGPTWAALAQAYERTGSTEQATHAREVAARSGNTLMLPDPLRAEVSTLGVSSKIALERGIGRMSGGDYRGALHDLALAAEQRGDDPWLQLRLATCCQETGATVMAARHFARAEELRDTLAGDAQDLSSFDAATERYRKKYLERVR